MTLKNYFQVCIKVSRQILDISLLHINFKKIVMESEEEDNVICIENRKFYYQPETKGNIICLLIQNDSNNIRERIDYLLDEEYIIKNLDLDIMLDGNPISFTIKSMNQIDSMEWADPSGLETRILNFEEVKNTVCILGPKPNNMFGYSLSSNDYSILQKKVQDELEKYVQAGKNIVLVNGYIGGETIGYRAAKELKKVYPEIMICLATPFLELDAKWTEASKKEYRQMIKEVDAFIEIDKVPHYKYGQPEHYMKEKFIKKNDFDLDHSDSFIVIKDYEGTMHSILRRLIMDEKNYIDMYYNQDFDTQW